MLFTFTRPLCLFSLRSPVPHSSPGTRRCCWPSRKFKYQKIVGCEWIWHVTETKQKTTESPTTKTHRNVSQFCRCHFITGFYDYFEIFLWFLTKFMWLCKSVWWWPLVICKIWLHPFRLRHCRFISTKCGDLFNDAGQNMQIARFFCHGENDYTNVFTNSPCLYICQINFHVFYLSKSIVSAVELELL